MPQAGSNWFYRLDAARLALASGLIPIIAVHLTYLISAGYGHVDWCFPYIHSCTSISATGRKAPEFYIFKATMIPVAVIMMLFWISIRGWFERCGGSESTDRSWISTLLPWIGILGATCLIVYTVALGQSADHFRLPRRIGVVIYFTFTYFAQLMVTYRVGQIREVAGIQPEWYKLLYFDSALVLAIGLLSLFLNMFYVDYDQMDDAFEWVLALLIHLHFLVTYLVIARRSSI